MALQLHINVLLNRPPDRTWRRPPGRPRNKWLDQLRNDSARPTGDLWRRAVDRGHGGGPRRLSDHDYVTMMMMMMILTAYNWRIRRDYRTLIGSHILPVER